MKKSCLAAILLLAFLWWGIPRALLLVTFLPEKKAPTLQAPQDPIKARADVIAAEIAQIAATNPRKPHVLIGLGGPSATTEIILALDPHADWPVDEQQRISDAIASAIQRNISWFKLIGMEPAAKDIVNR